MKRKLSGMPSQHDGDGFVTVGGNTYPAFAFSKLTLTAGTITDSKRFLGERVTQNAARGLNVTGNISYYGCTMAFIQAITDYKNGGDYPEITVQGWAGVTGTGRCEVLATGVIIANIGLLSLDDTSDSTTVFDSDLTANDYDLISKFNQ